MVADALLNMRTVTGTVVVPFGVVHVRSYLVVELGVTVTEPVEETFPKPVRVQPGLPGPPGGGTLQQLQVMTEEAAGGMMRREGDAVTSQKGGGGAQLLGDGVQELVLVPIRLVQVLTALQPLPFRTQEL